MKDRVDKSRGMETLSDEALAKITISVFFSFPFY